MRDFGGNMRRTGLPFSRIFTLNIALLVFILLLAPGAITQEDAYSGIVKKFIHQGLMQEGAYDLLRKITSLGPRLTGSPEAAAAVELMNQEMRDLGFSNVRLEPVTVGRWIPGDKEEALLVSSLFGTVRMNACAVGGSVPTPDRGIMAPVLEVKTFEELEKGQFLRQRR